MFICRLLWHSIADICVNHTDLYGHCVGQMLDYSGKIRSNYNWEKTVISAFQTIIFIIYFEIYNSIDLFDVFFKTLKPNEKSEVACFHH